MPRRPSVAQIERDSKAVDLRRRNLTYRQIKEQMGFTSVSRAYEAVQRGLLFAVREPADAVRQLELERLDEMARVAWRVLHERHAFVSQGGKIPLNPQTGQPLIDDGPTLAAMDRLLKISERRSKLLGLDAPTRHEVLTIDRIEAEIAALEADLAANDRDDVRQLQG